MLADGTPESWTAGRVVSQGEYLSVLVDSPLLGGRKACKVRTRIEGADWTGLGFALDEGSVLLVLEPPETLLGSRFDTQIQLQQFAILGGHVDFAGARKRLGSMLGVDRLGSISDRAARHALLFILEAHDPAVRAQRTNLLRESLRRDQYYVADSEAERFAEEGVIIRCQLVQPELIAHAREAIEAWSRNSCNASQIETYTQKTFAPELGSDPALLNIYRQSGLERLAASLVMPDLVQPVTTAQVQIRIPEGQGGSQQPVKALHVDGVACPHLDACELRTFTLLAGVMITETASREAGALEYVPGAHLDMARWFREEWKPGAPEQVPSWLTGQPRAHFCGRPGDVILMHHLLPHAVGVNRSNHPRINIYFRIKHERHDTQRVAALRDPWLEFPRLRTR
jgi:ectoine hydroxylase-related dioxygenase (phytanoyl-CoA dioxygenase family)